MKKLISVIVLSTLMTSAFAQVAPQTVQQYTCHDIYLQQAQIAKSKRDKYNKAFNKVRGDGSYNDVLTILGLVGGLVTSSVPVLVVGVLTPTTISIIKNIPKKEERALRLEKETSEQLNRFVARMQNKVSPAVTKEEVVQIIQSGFDKGEFCKDVSKLAGPVAIRRYVKAELKKKHLLGDVSQLLSQGNENECQEDDGEELN